MTEAHIHREYSLELDLVDDSPWPDAAADTDEDKRTDQELLEAMRRGDTSGFDGLYCRYAGEVTRVISGQFRGLEAEDVVQEAFTRAFKAISRGDEVQFTDEAGAGGWLYTMARRNATDRVRSPAYRRRQDMFDDNVLIERSSEGPSPEDAVMAAAELDELTMAMRGVINRLAPQQRRVLTLQYLLGYTTQECAEIIGISPEAVSVTKHWALARARKIMASLDSEQVRLRRTPEA